MSRTKWIAGAVLALSALASAPTFAAASIYVQVAPPAPLYEAVPAVPYGQQWVPGHWEWRHNRHVWVNGYVVTARPGYFYEQPQWVAVGNGWQYRDGGWAPGHRGGGRGYGDRDHDGVANRYDRDRDGDGVPNRWDRAPNNPNRR
ncbi:MAG: thrombospondin type 3 repeat-containing protein [Burkholderiales bacterium]|nr:thrombospondin type 3 repeat-containing protein [Burkholderiales bacterium]